MLRELLNTGFNAICIVCTQYKLKIQIPLSKFYDN